MSKTFDEKLDTRAAEFDNKWHEDYPEGMTVAPYVNQDVPEICYRDGAEYGYREGIAAAVEMLRKEDRESYYDAAEWLEEQFKNGKL